MLNEPMIDNALKVKIDMIVHILFISIDFCCSGPLNRMLVEV